MKEGGAAGSEIHEKSRMPFGMRDFLLWFTPYSPWNMMG